MGRSLRTTSASASSTFLSFADAQILPREVIPVQCLNRCIRCSGFLHLHKREAARASCLSILNHINLSDVPMSAKRLTKIVFSHRYGNVPNIESFAQNSVPQPKSPAEVLSAR